MLEMMDSVRPGNLDQKEPSTSAKGPTGVKRPRSPFAPKKSCGKQKVKVEEWPELPKAVSVEVGDWPGVPKAVEEVPVEHPRRRIVFKKRRTSQQQVAAADVVEVMSGPSPVTIEDCPPMHSSPDLIQSKVAANVDTLPVTFDAGSVSSGEEEIIVVSDTDKLPKQLDKDGYIYDFEYNDFVTGDVSVVEGEFIDAGKENGLLLLTLMHAVQMGWIQRDTEVV
uniref:uncharacterized protein LOC122763801 n=1 Tax=Solea senegalensis TaxID=28829 RepID=UPI001CD8C4D0|nr:uncharacterized protein LOC122763801 [Solea senegalensis]